ncbi:MAG: hypothetical protein Q7T11_03460 [Deltaproteobacteria bacterium]|nr:hypothetical protein [Deltaproteobacteria bacterium]
MTKLFFFLFTLFLVSLTARAAFFPPKMEMFTVKTAHFYIHYPKEAADPARHLLEMIEGVHDRVSTKYKWVPGGRTHVVLVDTSDRANGLATVLPANYILLYVTPPDADSTLDNYRDYLEMLFAHEYTHIIHMDQHHKWADPPHWVLGKIVAPNGLTPGWMREGMASFEESSTGEGRGNFSTTEMVIRASILENDFPHIDEAAGLGTRWPAADLQYLFGVKFWKWLADRYGEETVQKYMEKYSSGLWLFSLNNKAKQVYGKSFYKLWKEWQQDLTEKYGFVRDTLTQKGLTPFTPLVTDKGYLSYATPIPEGFGYGYLKEDMDNGPKIVLNQDGKASKISAAASGQISFSRDGKYLAYSALSGAEKYRGYADVYIYDRAKKTSRRVFEKDIKKSLRASDPDFAPFEGKSRWLVMVRTDDGTDNLYVHDLETKKGYFLTDAPSYTQFSNPRFSPNGETLAVSRKDSGGNRDIVLYSRKGHEVGKITDDEARDNHPVWSPTGASIYFDSDKTGISNIYRTDLKTKRSVQVTNVLTGAFQPQITPDGKALWVTYYTSKGPVLKQVPLEARPVVAEESGAMVKEKTTEKKEPPPSAYQKSLSEKKPESDSSLLPGSKKYNPFPLVLVPRYIMPSFLTLDDAYLFGLSTGSYDPLYRHFWSLFANYRTDSRFLGGGATYSYLRYNPSLYAGVVRYSLNWGDIFGIGSDFFEQRLQGFVGTSYLKGTQAVSLGYFYEDRDNFSAIPAGGSLASLDRYAGLRTDYVFARFKRFPDSISQEDGPFVKIGFDITDSMLGSSEVNEQQVVTADARYYFEMPWGEHHVLGFRAAGGTVWGDQETFQTFRFGGPFGEGMMAGYSSRLFPFRGLPGVTFSGDRVMLFTSEYRLPLAHIDRGIGTWPVFLRKIHMSFFSDFGDIWRRNGKDGRDFFEDFFLSVGSELKGDLTLGYGLPITGRIGYAIIVKNRDQIAGLTDSLFGNDIANGTFYLQFGTSF